ncbi:hypothetical protein [Myroides odoratus]|uniref:hypothetical protein n=1 Tax=Myroides odoratus TaxID=256 RepID=UPI0007659BBC|nr:hypothetical protein [Myroides odoratus]
MLQVRIYLIIYPLILLAKRRKITLAAKTMAKGHTVLNTIPPEEKRIILNKILILQASSVAIVVGETNLLYN